MSSKRFPARVHVILARDSKVAVAIRRGPSNSVCTLLWDRQRDSFHLGQWLKGRIYERRCDLSPDGKHLIYFAMNGKWSSEIKGSWSAISNAPYLKAMGLWANGSCWNGGGLFIDNQSYWLNAFVFGHEARLTPSNLSQNESIPFHEGYGGECPGVYYVRLQRDGWKLLDHGEGREGRYTTFEKALPKGWLLRKVAHETVHHPVGAGCYYDTHSILHPKREAGIDFPDWEWADLDDDRLVWISKGVLYASKLNSKGLGSINTLYDFNPLVFERIEAPY